MCCRICCRCFSGLIALQFGHNILNIAALGFLGIGVQPPAPEWGAMIAEARPYFSRAPWLAIMPGIYLFVDHAVRADDDAPQRRLAGAG